MTRKHYVKAAEIVKQETKLSYRHTMALAFIRFFADDNPKFNRYRFLEACGIEDL